MSKLVFPPLNRRNSRAADAQLNKIYIPYEEKMMAMELNRIKHKVRNGYKRSSFATEIEYGCLWRDH